MAVFYGMTSREVEETRVVVLNLKIFKWQFD